MSSRWQPGQAAAAAAAVKKLAVGGAALVLFTGAMSLPAHAAPSGANASVAADALFREGRSAAARGDLMLAAKLFADSERLSPAPGTRLNLALIEETLGRLLSAWEHARSALDQLEPSDARKPIAQALFDRLDPRLPRLELTGTLPSEARINLDGIALEASSLDVALPVDVGMHRVVITAPDRDPRVFTRNLVEGERARLVLALGPMRASASTTTPPSNSTDQGARAADRGSGAAPPRWPRTLGWIALGVGGGSLVASGVTGLLAIQKKHDVDAACDASGCDQSGVDASSAGRSLALASTVLGIGGAVVATGGLTLVLVAPKSPQASRANAAYVGASYALSF